MMAFLNMKEKNFNIEFSTKKASYLLFNIIFSLYLKINIKFE